MTGALSWVGMSAKFGCYIAKRDNGASSVLSSEHVTSGHNTLQLFHAPSANCSSEIKSLKARHASKGFDRTVGDNPEI